MVTEPQIFVIADSCRPVPPVELRVPDNLGGGRRQITSFSVGRCPLGRGDEYVTTYHLEGPDGLALTRCLHGDLWSQAAPALAAPRYTARLQTKGGDVFHYSGIDLARVKDTILKVWQGHAQEIEYVECVDPSGEVVDYWEGGGDDQA